MSKTEYISIVSNLDCNLKDRLHISPGIQAFDSGTWDEEKTIYTSGVFRPVNQWRTLSDLELKKITSNEFKSLSHQLVLFEIDEIFLTKFHLMKLGDRPEKKEVLGAMLAKLEADLFPELREFLESHIVEPFELFSVAIGRTPAGYESSTYDRIQNRYRGLHIDNWCEPNFDIQKRNRDAVRILINVGTEARDFSFLDLTLDQMFEALQSLGLDAEALGKSSNSSRFVETFMNHFANYPVMHLELYPGEGCIAPVCNMIHDGLPLFKQESDSNIQISSQSFQLNNILLQKLSEKFYVC